MIGITDSECMAVFRDLEEKKLLDKALYDKILDAATQRYRKRKKIKDCLLEKQKAS